MKAKHGYRFVSSISKEGAELLHESWEECITKKPKENDRARNAVFRIARIGTITLSLQTGSIIISTDLNEVELKEVLRGQLSKADYKKYCESIHCSEVGAHFTKGHGTARFVLDVKEPCLIPFSLSYRSGTIYEDFHARFRVPKGKGTIKDYRKGVMMPSPPPRRSYSDLEILNIISRISKMKKSITPNNLATATNLDLSSSSRRLRKFEKLGRLKRIQRYPAIYTLLEG